MGRDVAGPAMSGPAFQSAEAGYALRFGERVDAAGADHFTEARQPGYAVRTNAIAVGLGNQARRQRGAFIEAKLQQDGFDARAEFVKGNPNHAAIRTHHVDCGEREDRARHPKTLDWMLAS
jgi:hypothetical protein